MGPEAHVGRHRHGALSRRLAGTRQADRRADAGQRVVTEGTKHRPYVDLYLMTMACPSRSRHGSLQSCGATIGERVFQSPVSATVFPLASPPVCDRKRPCVDRRWLCHDLFSDLVEMALSSRRSIVQRCRLTNPITVLLKNSGRSQ